jgi:hypothetical protein
MVITDILFLNDSRMSFDLLILGLEEKTTVAISEKA